MSDPASDEIIENSRRIFEQQRQRLYRRTDRMFAVLMALQWVGGVVAAYLITPRTWHGSESQIHPHLWAAVVFGGLIAALPITLAVKFPGRMVTRHVIAICQMLFSTLFIHISGGRIETHFHVFGSLAFLAFYRDWPLLIPATLLVAADHFVRGTYWPESVFGVSAASPYRWIEHAAWVGFEDIFLIILCQYGVTELWTSAVRTAVLERMNADFSQRTVELEQSYQSKNAIIESALDAVVSMDLDGRISGWNSQAERTFGWTAEEAIGRRVSETIIPPRLRDAHEEGLRQFRATGASEILNKRIELTAINRQGEEFAAELSISPIQSGDTTTFCAFVRDINERLSAAEALCRAKDAAEAANRAKSAFLAHMSHEIRTPLNGILGFADVLLKMGADASEAERRDYHETINHSGRHLLELIDDILDLSKIESGQMEVEMVRCEPHKVVAQAISILRVRAQEKGINLEYRWDSPAPHTILTDPSRFRQLLMNLIGNAIKFTDRGAVEVVARLNENGVAPRLAIDVIDSGIGIASDSLERIFEPFTQADQSITRRFGGTGLGLAISRQISLLLGGGLNVESEPGRGSRFTVEIATGPLTGIKMLDAPTADLMPCKSQRAAGFAPVLAGASILLVEDGATNRKLISLVLRRAGADVTTAENGEIGLVLACQQKFDVILMDMQMPVLDGYMATTQLRNRGVTTPILALTAHSMKGDEERCRAAGCTGYLTKPINSDRLLNTVASVLQSSQDASEETEDRSNSAQSLKSDLPMDDPEFREIVIEFVDRLHANLDKMRAAASVKDYQTLGGLAHWLKGSAGTAGFNALTAAALPLEHAVQEGDPAAIAVYLSEITQLAHQIVIDGVPRQSPDTVKTA
jgi:two-component system sensor histidine kinase/response regulator